MKFPVMAALFTMFTLMACSPQSPPKGSSLAEKAKRFAPAEISADLSKLSPGNRAALAKLVEAARYMDSIYLEQKWSGNLPLLDKLRSNPASAEELSYFLRNMGPWSKLDNDEPFIDGVGPHPAGANYYPAGMTKEEFNSWAATAPAVPDPKGYFTVIRKDADGKLKAVPYNVEYQKWLEPASKLLKEASELTDNATLKKFLSTRADAFLSNDYYASDVAWMELDSPIEPTIGPYETYMDELFNAKAAFEAFITIRDDAASEKLKMFAAHLQEIEDNLPIDPKYRNPKLGALSPISVVDEVVTGGESREGVQTAAYNLPNDERVTREKGTKKVMLKNVQEAKFNSVLVPIAGIAVNKDQRNKISFDPFFTHILAHELMHGLGPHSITANGKATTVRESLQEQYSALEEAKADISGLFALQFLIDKGVLDKSLEEQMYATYVAGSMRSVRFGTNDAHGKGMALQFNYLSDEGAFTFDQASGTYAVDFGKVKPAVRKLTGEIMTIQAEGSYEKAKALLDKYGAVRPEMQKVLDRMKDLPVDINPHFSPVPAN